MTVHVLGQVFVFLHLSESARRMVFLDGHIARYKAAQSMFKSSDSGC